MRWLVASLDRTRTLLMRTFSGPALTVVGTERRIPGSVPRLMTTDTSGSAVVCAGLEVSDMEERTHLQLVA